MRNERTASTRSKKTASERPNYRRRSGIVCLMLLCMAVIVCGRLFWLQVVRGGEYAEWDLSQAQELRVLQSPRGTIYDRNGEVLAVSTVVKSLYADPAMINRSPDALAALLAPYLHVSAETLTARLQEDTSFVWLERMLDPDRSAEIDEILRKEHIEGVRFVEESKRYYPNGELLAQVLGFVGIDGSGLEGLESVLDEDIKGETKKLVIETSRHGTPILGSTLAPYLAPKERSVTLTIDTTIQFIAERALTRAMQSTKSSGGTVIVMDPHTGEILAMASRPTYDPNHFSDSTPESLRNRAVVNLYEPGSTFKPIVAAAALDSGKVTPEETYDDPGEVHVSGHVIRNWDDESYGRVRLQDIIRDSINTGFAALGLKTGGAILNDYAKRFGFGKKTGIEFPGEGEGILFVTEDMRDSDVATMSIGQSIAVTPLQMVQAFGALANDGKMMRPHILRSINNPDGTIYRSFDSSDAGQPVSPTVTQILLPMLEQVVEHGGGVKARIPGYRVAGKTGTAQKLNEEGSGYYEGRYIASFIGFGPVENPRAVCLVVLDDPEGVYYGGQIAAPVFAEVMSQIMRYYKIPPTRTEDMPSEAGSTALPTPTLQVERTAEGRVVIPNFAGYSVLDVLTWGRESGIGITPQGEGTAVDQDVLPGVAAASDETVTVYFSR